MNGGGGGGGEQAFPIGPRAGILSSRLLAFTAIIGPFSSFLFMVPGTYFSSSAFHLFVSSNVVRFPLPAFATSREERSPWFV